MKAITRTNPASRQKRPGTTEEQISPCQFVAGISGAFANSGRVLKNVRQLVHDRGIIHSLRLAACTVQ